jgi:adenosylmethionine-8-amino-7-oxononanoate aminotransferase
MSESSYPAIGGTQDIFFDRAGAQLLPTIVAGDGVHLVDKNGQRLLDACSGPFLSCLGQGNERVLQAMMAQGRKLTYTYSRTTRHEANAELAQRLASLAGLGFERAHLTSGGSEAIEMATKFLRAHAVATGQSQRTRLISLLPGYHGATFQTIGLNGDVNSRSLWDEMIVYSEKIPAPLTFRSPSAQVAAAASLTAFEEAIDRLGGDRILAVVWSP